LQLRDETPGDRAGIVAMLAAAFGGPGKHNSSMRCATMAIYSLRLLP
jgi:hypothetical protein